MKKLLLLGSLFLASTAASAATITFEGHNNTPYYSAIERSGYQIFNPAGQEQHFHEITSTGYGLISNGTGVLLNDRDTQIMVTNTLGSLFSLASVDLATSKSNSPATSILIESFLNGTSLGTISAVFGSGYTTLNGASLGTFDTLVFDGIGAGGGFVLDNLALEVANVPVPAAAFMFAPALLGFMGLRRKGKKTTA